jgi:hypothetical protein
LLVTESDAVALTTDVGLNLTVMTLELFADISNGRTGRLTAMNWLALAPIILRLDTLRDVFPVFIRVKVFV